MLSRIMLLGTTSQSLKYNNNSSSENDFIGVGLGGMGHSSSSYKKTIPNCKFIRGRFQTRIYKKKNILQIMFQNVLMDTKILKDK
jgi:hypothetical protein